MFGIGIQEMVLVGVLLLVLFGPKRLPQMARDIGRFVNEARRSVEEFKEEILSEEDDGQQPHKRTQPEGERELDEEDEGREELTAFRNPDGKTISSARGPRT